MPIAPESQLEFMAMVREQYRLVAESENDESLAIQRAVFDTLMQWR